MAEYHFDRMGSVRHRLAEVRHECNVVLVGDVRVGKSALVNRFINNKFSEVSLDRVFFKRLGWVDGPFFQNIFY